MTIIHPGALPAAEDVMRPVRLEFVLVSTALIPITQREQSRRSDNRRAFLWNLS